MVEGDMEFMKHHEVCKNCVVDGDCCNQKDDCVERCGDVVAAEEGK